VQLAPWGGYDVLVSAGVVQQSQHVAAIHLKKGGVHCSLVLSSCPKSGKRLVWFVVEQGMQDKNLFLLSLPKQ